MSSPAFTADSWKRRFPEHLTRAGWVLLSAGIVFCLGAYLVDARRSAFNNLVLFLFLASIAGGSIFLIALEYLAGAVWSVPMRRVNEFLGALTPLVPILALPLFYYGGDLYTWMHLDAVSTDPLIAGKAPYLNVPFFAIRFGIVFLVWILFYGLLTRNSRAQDVSGNPKLTTVNIRLSAVFMPVFAVTLTVLSIDWAMTLEAHWYSTIFGVYYFSGTVLAALAAATLVIVLLHERGYLPLLRRDHFYSLGALLFAFVNFWAYIAFSQFLLMWYANLPEETFWFIKRWVHGWQYVSILLIVMQFGVPYFALLAQDAKMDLRRLKFMAVWILLAHLLDVYWLVMPSFSETVPLGWIEIAFPIAGAGLVIVVLASRINKYNLVPVKDPKLLRGLEFHL